MDKTILGKRDDTLSIDYWQIIVYSYLIYSYIRTYCSKMALFTR